MTSTVWPHTDLCPSRTIRARKLCVRAIRRFIRGETRDMAQTCRQIAAPVGCPSPPCGLTQRGGQPDDGRHPGELGIRHHEKTTQDTATGLRSNHSSPIAESFLSRRRFRGWPRRYPHCFPVVLGLNWFGTRAVQATMRETDLTASGAASRRWSDPRSVGTACAAHCRAQTRIALSATPKRRSLPRGPI
jgi:hypothetical protein